MLPSYEQTTDVTASERHASEYEVDNTHINSVHSWTSLLGKNVFHEQVQQSKDAQRKRIKYETETGGKYEHRKYRDIWGMAQKHSHNTSEEQIASQHIDTKKKGLFVLHKHQRNMHLIP